MTVTKFPLSLRPAISLVGIPIFSSSVELVPLVDLVGEVFTSSSAYTFAIS